MTNNDILRRLRYSFNYNDNKMINIFKLADAMVTRAEVSAWLKKEEDEGYKEMADITLATFLNGFITEKRGAKEGNKPQPETTLNYNIILTKLKIALNLKAEDIIELLSSVNVTISKPELSAFFRKSDHKHYRVCKAQIMRNFMNALQNKYRVAKKEPASAKQQHKKSNYNESSKPRHDNTARPKASTPYVNPKAKKIEKPKSERKVLKLTPEEIWKNHD
ncbi:DUF1456 family protein [Thalassotalea atypica]|uniref:DUF1456 family protein n=1 Tax=Thalassotalea atypica TaxID=2054316 RepID=UPI003305C0A8